MRVALLLYVAGVLFGLWRTDARPGERLTLALLWPLGPIAFAATTVLLVALAVVTVPAFTLAAALAAAVTWWVLR